MQVTVRNSKRKIGKAYRNKTKIKKIRKKHRKLMKKKATR